MDLKTLLDLVKSKDLDREFAYNIISDIRDQAAYIDTDDECSMIFSLIHKLALENNTAAVEFLAYCLGIPSFEEYINFFLNPIEAPDE